MCVNGTVSGTEVYIDTDQANETTLDVGVACSCQIQILNGKHITVEAAFDGTQGSDCGASVHFISSAIGGSNRSSECENSLFDVTDLTPENNVIAIELTKSRSRPETTAYCAKISLSKLAKFYSILL